MKRTPFKTRHSGYEPRDPDRVRSTPTPSSAFRQAERIEGHAAAIEKENAIQHGVYIGLVKMLPCARCGAHGPSDFCHRDQGKAMGKKTDVREGFPGCRPCHDLLGSSGKIPRAERRELEAAYGRATRDKMRAMNLWPRTLADWPEED